jgi:diaminopimelate epimerase
LIVQEAISDEELVRIGKLLNQQEDLFPHGINVDAICMAREQGLSIKTYKGAKQGLTRCSGNGAMCCAALYLKNKPGKISVSNLGGLIDVTIHPDSIELQGSANTDSFQAADEEHAGLAFLAPKQAIV